MNFLVLLEKYSLALNPVLISAVVCAALVVSLLLVLLAFFPTLAGSIVQIIDSILYGVHHKGKTRSSSRVKKPAKRSK